MAGVFVVGVFVVGVFVVGVFVVGVFVVGDSFVAEPLRIKRVLRERRATLVSNSRERVPTASIRFSLAPLPNSTRSRHSKTAALHISMQAVYAKHFQEVAEQAVVEA